MSASELPGDPAGFFQDGWPVYRKIVDNNYMFHREIYGDITRFIKQRFQQRPISILELGCGDASQTAAALRNCRVSLYQGCDLSAVALGLAAQHLLPLSCPVKLVCAHLLEGLSAVDEPFDSENDFPETLSEYAAMAEASGFAGVDPLNRHTWHRTLALVNR